MHTQILPVLYLNLGGEMIYILDQRLKAQNIDKETASKVLSDIVLAMLAPRFLSELWAPLPPPLASLGGLATLRSLFGSLAHASVMRVDEMSMAKMWDLMVMVVKLQALRARSPNDLLMITLNHLDGLRTLVSVPSCVKLIDAAHQMVVQRYGSMSSGELQQVRYSLMTALQGQFVRVTIFLRHKVQQEDGTLSLAEGGPVPTGTEVPGTIRCIANTAAQEPASRVLYFPTAAKDVPPLPTGTTALNGDRGTGLGRSMSYGSSTGYKSSFVLVDVSYNYNMCTADEFQVATGTGATDIRPQLQVGREELQLLNLQLSTRNSEQVLEPEVIRTNLFSRIQRLAATCSEAASAVTGVTESSILSINAALEAKTRCEGLWHILDDLTIDSNEETNSANDSNLFDLLGDADEDTPENRV